MESLPWLLERAREKGKHPTEVDGLPTNPSNWRVVRDLDSWRANDLIGQCCIWLVSPSLARQAMTAAVQAWSESPLQSSHFFVIPRACQREFGRVDKHIEFLGQVDASLSPFSHPLPLTVFFLPVYRRRLSDLNSGLDVPPNPREPGWVSRQLKHMFGL